MDVNIPASGDLSTTELNAIFRQLFDENNNFTPAYYDPAGAVRSLAEAAGNTPINYVRLLALAGLVMAGLAFSKRWGALSNLPMGVWIAIAVVSVLALIFSFKKDKSVGAGDVTPFTVSPQSAALPGNAAGPASRAPLAGPLPSNPLPSSIIITGPNDPSTQYIPFYLRTDQGPLYVTPNTDALEAVSFQRGELRQANAPGNTSDRMRRLQNASTANKNLDRQNK